MERIRKRLITYALYVLNHLGDFQGISDFLLSVAELVTLNI